MRCAGTPGEAPVQPDHHRRPSATLVHTQVETSDRTGSKAVADLLELRTRSAVNSRSRGADFPAPVIDTQDGACLLQHRTDVEAWSHSIWGS